MLNKFSAASFGILCLATSTVYAENDFSCKVQVAVSTPPVLLTDNVAFNINSVDGTGPNKSMTLKGGSAPQLLDVACYYAYTISATIYPTPSSRLMSPIGECSLKAGNIAFNYSNDNISVVFPNDFICNQA
ncbi:hypothetical protein [Legionella hackeliae]|uniref:Uncharacterized protein n=1 Tax=Legionella hackeliae TaxID=449 RepID=A0A0A8UME8_LEGHA|nr:hypothetical protein [Legionella hackeliae]KTD10429.1 hypothetical protein Lhac_2797 [Legionella hackeliae]CEK09928.1 conserved exported protein of unknown function [Legionella hackeliae]STX49844.1 Uncharacterised protein [Legionella hackeliae]